MNRPASETCSFVTKGQVFYYLKAVSYREVIAINRIFNLMHPKPVTPEQVTAHFKSAFKTTTIKNMAQEIADLANKQVALIQQIQRLEGIIQANGGVEALNLTRYITEARNELSHTKQVNAELIASTQRRAQEILEGAQQSVRKQRAELKKEVMAEAQPAIEAEIAKQVEIRGHALKKQAEQEAKASAFKTANIEEIALANAEAARILDEARAQTFAEAARTWKQGHENWKRVHDQSQFIPSPISTVALEFVSVLETVGEFHPGERRLNLAGDYGSATLSVGKKEAAEPVAELLGRPEPGESITRTLDVQLVAQRHTKANERAEKYVFGYSEGHLVGGLTRSYSNFLLPFIEAMETLGVRVVSQAEVTLSAAKSSGNLQVKSSLGMPDRYAVRDTMPKIYRLAKTLNSIYIKNQLLSPDDIEWLDKFGRLSLELRQSLSSVRDWRREMRIMGD